jgi:macrophage erythroblast attacher
MGQDKLNHEGLLALEQPLIKVPLEQLKRDFRGTQRIIEREMTAIASAASQFQTLAPELQEISITNQIFRLETLKRKLSENTDARFLVFSINFEATKKRIQHLSKACEIQSPKSEEFTRWSKVRLGRVICDYLLRKGYIQTGKIYINSKLQCYLQIHNLKYIKILIISILLILIYLSKRRK